MLMIDNVLISDEVIEEHFLCNLNACKGACCWEGDLGAPLEIEECDTLDAIYEKVRPFLRPEGIKVIEEEGTYNYNPKKRDYATPLVDGGPCAYMVYDELRIARCGIELAQKAGAINFLKPISCHLYPIRILKSDNGEMEALNYDRWDICSAACELGDKEQLPVYQFVRPAIERKYGKGFYEQLAAAAKDLK